MQQKLSADSNWAKLLPDHQPTRYATFISGYATAEHQATVRMHLHVHFGIVSMCTIKRMVETQSVSC